MKRMSGFALLILLAFSVLLQPTNALAAEIPAGITLKDLDGNPVLLADYTKDKVTVIVFWATWCIPCKKELPDLNRFYAKHQDDGVQIIGISTDTTRDLSKVKPYVNTRKFAYPMLLGTEPKLAKLLNPWGTLPYTVVVDWKGGIQYERVGYKTGDLKRIEKEVKRLLKEKAVAHESG